MSVGIGTAIAIGAGVSAAGGIADSVIGSNAAGKAANQETAAIQPYASAGTQSLGTLMSDINSGKFGPGSIPSFTAPTLSQAEQYPGYQFAQEQGDKGILEASAATGGAITGGTAKSLSGYNQNLATNYYGQAFNQALSSYQAALTGQQQSYNQLLAPAQLGESAASSVGQAQAAGTVGSANAITSGISGATNSVGQLLLASSLFGSGTGTTPASTAATAAGFPNQYASAPMATPSAGQVQQYNSTALPAVPPKNLYPPNISAGVGPG